MKGFCHKCLKDFDEPVVESRETTFVRKTPRSTRQITRIEKFPRCPHCKTVAWELLKAYPTQESWVKI